MKDQEWEEQEEQKHLKYLNEDGTMTIPLDYPVKVKNNEMESLTFNRLNGRKMRAIDNEDGGMGKQLALIAKSAQIPVLSAEQLDFADLAKIGEALEDFLSSSPQIGKKSSGE